MPAATRIALAYLSLTGLIVGVWASGFPALFYYVFPGFGRTWVSVDGPVRSPSVVRDLIQALRAKRFAGAVAIGAGSAQACVSVAGACQGHRVVSMVSPPVSFDAVPAGPRRALWLVPVIARMLAANAAIALGARLHRVRTNSVWGGALVDNAVGPMIYADYLPQALADGRHVTAPPALVVGEGFAEIPAALERLKAGVSAQKLVVTL